jgi:hypothetical protein
MNRPSLSVRLAGSPRGALLLFICYGVIWYGWYEGHTVWWVALGTVGAALRTLRAGRELRRYKAWLVDWQAMSGNDAPARSPRKRLRGWMLTIGAMFIVVATLLSGSPGERPSGAVTVIWSLACLYLVFALLRSILRRVRGRRNVKAEVAQAKDEDAPVAWLLDRPASSPSRAETERNLPEYCARLIASK